MDDYFKPLPLVAQPIFLFSTRRFLHVSRFGFLSARFAQFVLGKRAPKPSAGVILGNGWIRRVPQEVIQMA